MPKGGGKGISTHLATSFAPAAESSYQPVQEHDVPGPFASMLSEAAPGEIFSTATAVPPALLQSFADPSIFSSFMVISSSTESVGRSQTDIPGPFDGLFDNDDHHGANVTDTGREAHPVYMVAGDENELINPEGSPDTM